MATPLTTTTVPDFTHCEFYSFAEGRAVHLGGEWLSQAGFIDGMPIKVRVMKDCIVITPQNGSISVLRPSVELTARSGRSILLLIRPKSVCHYNFMVSISADNRSLKVAYDSIT